MGDSLRNALGDIVTFLPKLLLAAIILVVGYVIAKALEKLLVKVLERVGFDRAVERGGIRKALQNSSYDASQVLAKIVFYAVMLFVLSTAFGVFGQNPISDYLSAIIGYLPKVFVAILILVIAAAIAAGVKLVVQNSLGSLSYARTLATAASTVVLALGVIAALDQLQIAQNVVNAVLYAVLVAVVGVVVVAVGGGGIVPMRQRWENALSKVEAEAPNVRREAQQARPASEVLQAEGNRLAEERREAERAEAERRAAERAEAERRAAEERQRQEAERQRQEAERAEAERQRAQQAEADRMAAERTAQQQAAGATAYAPPAQEGYQPTQVFDQQSYAQPEAPRPDQPGPEQTYGQHDGAARDDGQQYAEQPYADQPHADQPYGQQYGDQRYGEQLYGDQQYGEQPHAGQPDDGRYGEQYGAPQPWSTGSVPAPDPQQAYAQPPVPTDEHERTDEPGTAQLPRITDDTPPPDQGQQR